jgi:putative ABC transport system permease protein
MSLFKIAWRSIQERALASTMTALSMALGVALVIAVLVFQGVIGTSFNRAAEGYDIIIGAKGGRLELVLNTVFHLGQPIENIPWDFYKEFTLEGPTGEKRAGKYSSVIDVAVPYCLGDNFKGFRVVGTTPSLFYELGYGIDEEGRPIPYRFSAGESFAPDDYFGAVVGSVVAHRAGLRVGDPIEPTHGVTTEEGQGHKHDPFIIRGILAPNGTPNDRAVFVNMEGFFLLEGHAKEPEGAEGAAVVADAAKPQSGKEEHHDHAGHVHAHGAHHDPLPEDQRAVTAILIRTNHPTAGLTLPRSINKGLVAQAVMPIAEIRKLFDGLIGNLQLILLVLSLLIMFVAAVGIMVSIYNSMSERRREIAIMRALGAGRGTIRSLILLESILLSIIGGGAGFLLGHGLIGLLSPFIAAQTGVPIGLFQFVPMELALIPGLIILATLAGYIPALSAYRTDVAKALSASP